MILPVTRLGHPILRKKAVLVRPGDILRPQTQELIDSMFETMVKYEGIGLAANQVGQSLRICVFGLTLPGSQAPAASQTRVLINPRVTAVGRGKKAGWEGCLSVPGLRARVNRFRRVRVKALNRAGKKIEFTATGLPAVVIQHEADHLQGLVFLDRVTDRKSLSFPEEYQKFHAKKRR